MLADEIELAQQQVRTDAYQMSIGEIVGMYGADELKIDPEFQRLFRWDMGQKSKLIESLLLGIPIPPIFVFEVNDGNWELVDGLQRISTILEFMGLLKDPDGNQMPPSILNATKYLPSLYNTVWEISDKIPDVPEQDQVPLDKRYQLSIRRARISVEILKRPSDEQTKYELFQRLNAGGTLANAQELRNCIMIMVDKDYYRAIKGAAEKETFKSIMRVTDSQIEKQRHIEYAVRFIVHASIPFNPKLDVTEFIDDGIVNLATEGNSDKAVDLIDRTFGLLNRAIGRDALCRYENGSHAGKVGFVALESIAVGIAKNIDEIEALPNLTDFIKQKIQDFWSQSEVGTFTSAGLNSSTRIQRTIPFGKEWFKP